MLIQILLHFPLLPPRHHLHFQLPLQKPLPQILRLSLVFHDLYPRPNRKMLYIQKKTTFVSIFTFLGADFLAFTVPFGLPRPFFAPGAASPFAEAARLTAFFSPSALGGRPRPFLTTLVSDSSAIFSQLWKFVLKSKKKII